jgi:hypothetical protein
MILCLAEGNYELQLIVTLNTSFMMMPCSAINQCRRNLQCGNSAYILAIGQ